MTREGKEEVKHRRAERCLLSEPGEPETPDRPGETPGRGERERETQTHSERAVN